MSSIIFAIVALGIFKELYVFIGAYLLAKRYKRPYKKIIQMLNYRLKST